MQKFTLTLVFACLFVCQHVYGEDESWSGCWTQFPALSTICKSEYGAEYEPGTSQSCGTLSLGKKVLCKRSYPGCEATACYSTFIPKDGLCEREFDSRLPVTKGTFVDCAPGFYRSRCCPN